LSLDSSLHAEKFAPSFVFTALACLFVLVFGLCAFYYVTQAGQSFTTETKRRTQIDHQSQTLAPRWVVNQFGEKIKLDEFLKSSGKTWIADFVYTRCESICLALGSNYQQLQEQIKARGLESKVNLLSISFDPARDDAAALAKYAQRFKMDPNIWQIVSLSTASDRRFLLDEFGIMVIPAQLGEYEHNGAFHVLSKESKLIKILDYEKANQVLDIAISLTSR
jgi:protein SCO1